jgi:hypothetical protein
MWGSFLCGRDFLVLIIKIPKKPNRRRAPRVCPIVGGYCNTPYLGMSLHNEHGFTGYRANGSFTVAPRSRGEANDRVIALQNLVISH